MRQQLIDYNNEAVELVQRKQYKDATKMFLAALTHMKGILQQRRKYVDIAVTRHCNEDSNHDNFFTGVPLRNNDSTTQRRAISGSQIRIYDRILLLSPSHDPLCRENRDLTSALVLYNMGITNHVRGMQESNIQALYKALTLYRLAQSSAHHWSKHSSDREESTVLHLAIWNNMAHVCAQLDEMSEYTSCIHQVERALHSSSTNIPVNEFFFFSMNVSLHCQQGGGGGAPAA